MFGAELRFYRTRAGLSQQDLAARATVSHDVISKIETGERPPSEDFPPRLDAVPELLGAADEAFALLLVPYQSRWPIDVGSVVYTDHAHYTLFLLDTQDDSVLAAPRPAEAFQLIVQGLGDSPGILAQRPADELENRPSGVERDSPGRPRLESSEHSGRELDGVCVAHASASSWRWRSSSAARRSSSVW